MPFLPNLSEGNQSRAVVDTFGGYNHNIKIGEGEWYDEQNLTSDYYPVFANRKPMSTYKIVNGVQNIIAKDALAWIADPAHMGAKLYYNDYEIDFGLGLRLNDEYPKQLVSMGAYLCIFPDGLYVNTADLTDRGSMEAYYDSNNFSVRFIPCDVNGNDYDNLYASASAPESATNGEYWMDTSGSTHVLKQYSAPADMWVEIPNVYVKIVCNNIGANFSQYDGVIISHASHNLTDDGVLKEQVEALNGTAVIQKVDTSYIVIPGILDEEAWQLDGGMTVHRKVPKMDYVCESNNRLWGCRYGMTNGKTVNEIYACKLGDFKNWNCFQGISTDSYAVSVGTDGKFTGCIAYLGYPTFFKENYIHRISGNMPSNYQMATTACRGVQDGSWASLAIVNEILYYKSRTDVCAYDGSLPVGVSVQLGNELYHDAVAGAHGGKYYIGMRSSDGGRLFVYDTLRGLWHRIGNAVPYAFASWGDELYYSYNNTIVAINGTVGRLYTAKEWYAESGMIGYELVDHQYVSRYNIRMKLAEGAKCTLAIEYDSDGRWIEQGTIHGQGTDSFVIPVIPQRCDHFRIRLSGIGDIRIYSITKMIEQGSDA